MSANPASPDRSGSPTLRPYYEGSGVALYHGDWRDVREVFAAAHVLVTDPPFGIGYETGWSDSILPRSIANDSGVGERDSLLEAWPGPALVFGSWRRPRPSRTKMVLIWDSKGALGMGDLSLPWKPAHQEIYVIGGGFTGPRTSDVLTFAPVQAKPSNGRTHPNEKPVALMRALIRKTPAEWSTVLDPFAGSGTTLVAAKSEGRQAIGVELDERYCEVCAERLSQEVLDFGEPHV